MYKKRFAKWGLQKNRRHSKTKDVCTGAASGKAGPPASIPGTPDLSRPDALILMVLTSLRSWGTEFFESVLSLGGDPATQYPQLPSARLQPFPAREISFAVKLVADLLDRECGSLAGRMARKAFLLAEDILMLEAPVLAWTLLDMMHHMVTLRQARLFQMLLAHLIALTDGQMPDTHPLRTLLRGLWGIAASLANAPGSPGSSTPSSMCSSPPSSSSSSDRSATVDPWLLSRALPPLLERAWALNAELVFDHLDSRFFPLYMNIPWESSSISPSAAIISAADKFFIHMDVEGAHDTRCHLPSLLVVRRHYIDADEMRESRRHPQSILAEHGRTQGQSHSRTNFSPPRNYEMLRANSIAALRERWDSVRNTGFSSHNTSLLLRMITGLATAKVFDGTSAGQTGEVPRAHVRAIACATKLLIELDAKNSSDTHAASSDAIVWLRAMVALREYAEDESDPQVVWEMQMLRDALFAAGEYEEARELEQDACRRMEKYVQDVPVDSAQVAC